MSTKVLSKLLAAALSAAIIASCSAKRQYVKTHTGDPGEIVTAEGSAPIIDNNVIEARSAALADAQKNAVEMSVGVYVTSKTMVEKSVLIQSDIIARTQGYITRYDVLDERKDGDFYRVRIKALVKLQDISKDLKASGIDEDFAAVKKHKVVVLLAESIDGTKQKSTNAQSALSGELLKKNYIVADYPPVSGAELDGMIEGREDLYKRVFRDTNADALIAGSAKTEFFTDQNLGGFISYRANITLRAVKADTFEVLLNISNASSGVDVTRQSAARKALENAGKVSGGEAALKLAGTLKKYSNVKVDIANVKDLNTANKIINHIRQAGFVRRAVLQELAAGSAVLDVELNSEDSKALAEFMEKFEDGSLSVSGLGKYQITAGVKN